MYQITIFVMLLTFSANGREVCCPDGNCYSMDPPWSSPTRPVPDVRCNLNCSMQVFTRQNPDNPYIIDSTNLTIACPSYDPKKCTYILIPGWLDNPNNSRLTGIKEGIISKKDCNVIVFDYWEATSNLNYFQAVSDIRAMANCGVRIMNFMRECGAQTEQFHQIGHSLGAHTACYMGLALPEKPRKTTGLDPAGPLFPDDIVSLSKECAEFVEIMSVNAGGLGTSTPNGHVIYLMNGGQNQPSCPFTENPEAIVSFDNVTILPQCSHSRAPDYYAESIQNPWCEFDGYPENDFEKTLCVGSLGYACRLLRFTRCKGECRTMELDDTSFEPNGTFIIPTNWSPPYCLGTPMNTKRLIKKFLSSVVSTISGPIKLLTG